MTAYQSDEIRRLRRRVAFLEAQVRGLERERDAMADEIGHAIVLTSVAPDESAPLAPGERALSAAVRRLLEDRNCRHEEWEEALATADARGHEFAGLRGRITALETREVELCTALRKLVDALPRCSHGHGSDRRNGCRATGTHEGLGKFFTVYCDEHAGTTLPPVRWALPLRVALVALEPRP